MNITQALPAHSLTSLPPAQLWIGVPDFLESHAIDYIQKIVCPNKGCSVCIQCHLIRQKQHHAVVWINPEKNYTLDDLSAIFTTISYALNPGEHLFFVMHKADSLTLSCANSLLKSIEEPPPGYHFILLAQRQEQILPTIRSRCIIQSLYSDAAPSSSTLFAFFSTEKPHNPIDFLAALDLSKIHERESVELLDQLMIHWITLYKKAISERSTTMLKKTSAIIEVFMRATQMPPMPGSSKIFWKDLFLQTRKIFNT